MKNTRKCRILFKVFKFIFVKDKKQFVRISFNTLNKNIYSRNEPKLLLSIEK